MIDLNYVKELVASLLEMEVGEIEDDTKVFVDLEMDSMTFMEMVYLIEKRLNIKLEHQIIKYDLSIRDITDGINEILRNKLN